MRISFKAILNYVYIRYIKQNILIHQIQEPKRECVCEDKINIAISTNNTFIEQTLVFMLSLENVCCKVNLHVLNINLSDDTIKKIKYNCPKNVNLNIINIDSSRLEDLKISEKWPMEAWARVLIPELIDEKYVLYADVDCVVVDNIVDLLKYKEYLLSGVRSTYYYNEHHIENGINSGIILMNCMKLRDFNFFDKIITYAKENKDKLVMPDQDTINAVCSEHIYNIPLKYNVMNFIFANTSELIMKKIRAAYYDKEQYRAALFSPVIIHFNGGPFARPWQRKRLKHPYYKVYNYYKNKISN